MYYFSSSRRAIAALTFSLTAALAITANAQDQDGYQDHDDHSLTGKAHIMQDRDQLAPIRSNAELSDFIASEHGQSARDLTLVVEGQHNGRSGTKHVRFQQRVDGLKVHGAYVKAAYGADGRLSHVIENTVKTTGPRTQARIPARGAKIRAMRLNFGRNARGKFFYKPPKVEKVYIPAESGALEEGFLVESWSRASNQLYYTLLGGDGRILENELRTANDSYNVFADHPVATPQAIVSDPADMTASPSGWLSGAQTTLVIQGNNARAYLDRNNDNLPDGGGSVVTDGNFLTSHFPLQDPTIADNQEASVQNLFYWNNFIHDDLYHHGFVEGTFNFQEDNFGKGGLGSDSVEAQAQDGGSTNNANFATPLDGTNPRMQMYIWTRSTPFRDSALDTDVVWHEYGHGLTWRMIGSMSGPVSGAIGEGMSDVLSILHNNDDKVGEFSNNDPFGIRSEPYTNYSRSLNDFTGGSVHFDGEIYAATIWRLSELANADGVDNEALMDILVDGMNYTPAGPDYLDMRDGILASLGESSDLTCMVWQAFADFGMGDGAVFDPFGSPAQIIESSALSPACAAQTSSTGPAEVVDLAGSPLTNGRSTWLASATVTIKTPDTPPNNGRPGTAGEFVQGVTVKGTWSTGPMGSCVTGENGTCRVELGNLSTSLSSVDYTVDSLDGSPATGMPLMLTIEQNPAPIICTSCPPPRSLRRR